MLTRFVDGIAYLPSPLDRWMADSVTFVLSSPKFKYSQYCLRGIKQVFPHKTDKERQTLFKQSQKHLMESMLNFSKRSPKYMMKTLENIRLHGYEKVESLVASGRSIVAVSIHMSDFFHGLLKLSQKLPEKRKIGLIKLLSNEKREQFTSQKMNQLNVDVKYFNVSKKPAIEVLRFLKSGGVMLTFLDIMHSSIKTTDVLFFNRQAKIPCGPTELAIASKSVIVPLYTHKSEEGEYILTIEDPIDTKLLPQVTFAEKTKLATQQLTNCIQTWIKQFPEQWEFWWLVNEL